MGQGKRTMSPWRATMLVSAAMLGTREKYEATRWMGKKKEK